MTCLPSLGVAFTSLHAPFLPDHLHLPQYKAATYARNSTSEARARASYVSRNGGAGPTSGDRHLRADHSRSEMCLVLSFFMADLTHEVGCFRCFMSFAFQFPSPLLPVLGTISKPAISRLLSSHIEGVCPLTIWCPLTPPDPTKRKDTTYSFDTWLCPNEVASPPVLSRLHAAPGAPILRRHHESASTSYSSTTWSSPTPRDSELCLPLQLPLVKPRPPPPPSDWSSQRCATACWYHLVRNCPSHGVRF